MASVRSYNLQEDYDDFDEPDSIADKSSHLLFPEFNHSVSVTPRDLTLKLPNTTSNSFKHFQPTFESPESDDYNTKYFAITITELVSLITENLLSHPFIVLRRQCQVHHNSKRYHLTPFTLVPSILKLQSRQSCTTLFKGIGSSLLVRGMNLAVEDFLTKITPWPKEINSRSTMKQFSHHLLLKALSFAVVTPFYAASLVETVQSDIASEKPGMLDVFKEGSARLLAWNPAKGRMIPVYQMCASNVSYCMSKYLFSVIVKGISSRIISRHLHNREEKKGARPKDLTGINNDIELYSNIISLITSEIVFFPIETIIHRIQLQGTRTIIDSLDTGVQVVPILTSYEGAIDCYHSTIATEGFLGLYKGFGAMILQFAAHLAVIKISKWIINQVVEICSEKAPQKVTEFYNIESAGIINNSHSQQHGGTSTVSRSLSYVSSLNDEP